MIISIIIPTYNEEDYLPNLLDSIKRQNFDGYEVIVADANSTDRTLEIAESYGCIVVDGGLPAVGRNNGARVAKGEYLLFLDSDLELTDDYLRNVLYEFRMEHLGIAITKMKPMSDKIEDKIFHDFANYFMIGVENIKPHGAGCYGIITKKSLHDECGGFDESLTFGEDTDYIERLAEKERFKVLRNAKIGVSTRRLEEEGIVTLIRQYGKSTVNDFLGKRTDAEDLNYNFGHGHEKLTTDSMDSIAKRTERLNRMKKKYDKSVELVKTAQDNLKKSHVRDRKVVFYCVCGEGMGHSIRTGVIVDRLKEKYDIYLFTHGNAYDYLNSKFDNVYKIGGFNTVYINNKVDNVQTLVNALKRNPQNMRSSYEELYKKAKELSPDVIVTDFEIYSTYVAKLLNIPLISLDNMHIITQADISYPQNQRLEMLKAKAVIKTYVVKPKIHIITSFFYPKVRRNHHAVIYPPIIREDILKLEPTEEDHIIVYQTSKESVKLVKRLKALKDEKFIVYGFNKEEVDGNLTYKLFNEDVFYDDLASAKAVVCNGGFTFISEAITLKKPIYSVPAKGNFEQVLNGYYVQRLGYGEYHEVMSVNRLAKFLKKLPKYQKRLSNVKKYNNDGIIKELTYRIEKYSK
ncbi:MAG: glycosyltransferase [Methanobrevibacter sp.]|uniref:MJ1255/VC2487 family glycosyltransferase n=1 Tax=Methanobrevibacter TaxID=2172 RepID=UPI00257CB11F|nr:MJ1255/VC2487 family glycosyltransferase [Methanobrevibacter sp.]MBR2666158.1 glycosyltransferase [Methanobrevibacter sp.]MBR3197437.1 glycosyltransferase [Methanobrevibacter sp.]MBR7050388.1 glycosyltransferase [Methanobrevibacter sp.]